MVHELTILVDESNHGLAFPLFANGYLDFGPTMFRWRSGLVPREANGRTGRHHEEQYCAYTEVLAGHGTVHTLARALNWCEDVAKRL